MFKSRNGKTLPFQQVGGNGQRKARFVSLLVTTDFPAERDKCLKRELISSLSMNPGRVKLSKHITCPPLIGANKIHSLPVGIQSPSEEKANAKFSQRKNAEVFAERERQNKTKNHLASSDFGDNHFIFCKDN